MKKNAPLLWAVLVLTAVSCQKDQTYLITNTSVGKLNKTDKVSDLETIFSQDSIVRDTTTTSKKTPNKRIKIFEKGGPLLLTLTPNTDSIPTVENVRIEDPRYLSKEGVGLNSTFKDINDNYTIEKIITALNNIVITVKESKMYFTISKEELPGNVRFSNQKIEAVQIPDDAKIKFVMVSWAE